jgi:hypothetical protein
MDEEVRILAKEVAERQEEVSGESRERTPYAVICRENPLGGPGCGKVYLTQEAYDQQMLNPDATWKCPRCGCYPVDFDDDNYEEALELVFEAKKSEKLEELKKELGEDRLQELLDGLVHDLKSKEGSDINNSGMNTQWAYLIDMLGLRDAVKAVKGEKTDDEH